MERAARLITNNKLSKKVFSDEDLARAVWPDAVGKAIAASTSRMKLVRKKLVVEVKDAVWQQQLHLLSRQILDRLWVAMGGKQIEDLEFRVAVPKREPQRAESRESAPAVYDEADGIQDAVLKKVYQLSRKKATA